MKRLLFASIVNILKRIKKMLKLGSLNVKLCRGLAFFVLMSLSLSSSSQDYIFSQFYNAPLQLNPAFAGNTNYPNVAINYRNQWPSINTSYVTYSASVDKFFNKYNSGLGFWISNDNQADGVLQSIDIKGIYSYRLRFETSWQLKVGIEAGFKQTRLDWDKLIFIDQIDQISGNTGMLSTEIRPDNLNSGAFDVSMGMLLYNPKVYAGFSLKHLNSPYLGFAVTNEINSADRNGIPVYMSLHGGYQIIIYKGNNRVRSTFISPNALLAKQGDFYQVNLGTYIQVRSVFGGAWVRHTFGNVDALIFSLGFDTGSLKIGYSFDLTTSNLGISTGGSHELGILIKLFGLSTEESKLNDCLSLFR